MSTSLLAAHGLGFGYGAKAVGRDVDLAVRPGEVLCLLGPNGSGKTTLFKTMLGLLPAQAGEVRLEGARMAHMSRGEIARRVAYVPQAHAAHFPFRVLDMVVMGRTAHLGLFAAPGEQDRRKALAALAALGIADLAENEYTRISGGQRQLALVARALAQDAPAIVMDEPTASLDFGNQVLVLSEVKRLAAKGLAVLLSTHPRSRLQRRQSSGAGRCRPVDRAGRARRGAYTQEASRGLRRVGRGGAPVARPDRVCARLRCSIGN
jgi:iron complex transport system ATP-binding protein